MPFQPEVNQELIIDDVTYRIAEHPAAPGIPYGQEGRQAIVYALTSPPVAASAAGGGVRAKAALKVFKARYRLPELVSLADQIALFAGLSGLQVCQRTVLVPQRHAALLRQHPDLTYAVLMPWVEGPTWMEVLLEKRELSPEDSLALARSLAEILATMEQRRLAHCDLSGPNVMLPYLIPSPNSLSDPERERGPGGRGEVIALVDVEQLYGPGLVRPELLPGGSPGYAHKTAPQGLWSSTADRFAGAVLLAEMLGCCDARVREAAWGENYFEPQEMQRDSERYQALVTVLRERWGDGVGGLFERAWRSETLADCPTFGEWLVTLPEEVPVVEATPVLVPSEGAEASEPATTEDTLRVLMDLGRQFEEQGKLESALHTYRQAQALAPAGSGLAEELALIVQDVEAKQEEAVTAELQPPLEEEAEVEAVTPTPEPLVEEETEEEAEAAAPAPQLPLEEELALIAQDVEVAEEAAALTPEPLAEEEAEGEVTVPGFIAQRVSDHTCEEGEVEEEIAVPAPQSPLAQELALIAQGAGVLEEEAEIETAAVTPESPPEEEMESETEVSTLEPPVEEEAKIEDTAFAPESLKEEPDLDQLFDEGLAAYEREEWGKAQELLEEVVRRQPDYARGELRAEALLAEMEKRQAPPRRKVPDWAWALGGLAVLVLVVSVAVVSQSGGRRIVIEVTNTPTATSEAATELPILVTGEPISISNAESVVSMEILSSDDFVETVAFSPAGDFLAWGGDGGIWLWDLNTNGLGRHWTGHSAQVHSVAFSPDGQMLVSGGAEPDSRVRIWDIGTAEELRVLEGHYGGVYAVFSPRGDLIASRSGSDLWLWDPDSGLRIKSLTTGYGYCSRPRFSPDGSMLAAGNDRGLVYWWSVPNGELLQTRNPDYSGGVEDVAFSPDGSTLASAIGRKVLLWSVDETVPIQILEGHTDVVRSIAFSFNGTLLASGSNDNTVRLWAVSNGELLATLYGHTSWVQSVAFSPGGKLLASGSDDGTVRLWGVR